MERCQTLSKVMQCYITVSKRYPTLYQRCALLYRSHATFQAVQRCQTLSNAVQHCCNVAKHYTKLCDVVAKLCNVEICTTLALVIQRFTTLKQI